MELYHRNSFEEAATTAHFTAVGIDAQADTTPPLAGFVLIGALGGVAGFVLSLLAGAGILLGLAAYSVMGIATFLGAVAIRLAFVKARPAPLVSGPSLDAGARHAAWFRAARQGGRNRPGGLPEEWTRNSIARPVPLRPYVPLPLQSCIQPAPGVRPNGGLRNWRQRARALYRN